MDIFNFFVIPLVISMIITWVISSAVIVFIFHKTIPDEKKRKKAITGFLFLTISILVFLLVSMLSTFA